MLHYAAATYNWSDYFELPADAQLVQHHSGYVNTAIDNLKNMGDQSVAKRLAAAVKVPLVDFRTPDKNVWWAKARGTKGDIYIVKINFSKKSAKCTCADFANRGVVCKHIIKVALEMQEMLDVAKEQILAMEERSAIQSEGLQDSDDPLQRAFQSRGASYRRRRY